MDWLPQLCLPCGVSHARSLLPRGCVWYWDLIPLPSLITNTQPPKNQLVGQAPLLCDLHEDTS